MIDIEKVIPTKDMVIVKLLNIDEVYEDLITLEKSDELEVAVRYGEVISLGPDVDSPTHCRDLKPQEKVVFTEFAGYYIATDDKNGIYKAIRGYDIIGKYMKEDDITTADLLIPTENRVLVEIIDFTKEDDGIIVSASDPKLADLTYGRILKINKSINKLNLVVSQEVAFAPYVGSFVRNYESEDKKALKVIVEDDILFTL